MNIANRSLMCSTLVIGCLPRHSEDGKQLIIRLKNSINSAELSSTTDLQWTYDPENNYKGYRQRLDGYKVKDFAFMIGTVTSTDKVAMEWLGKLGFIIDQKSQYNAKNETHIKIFYGRVNEILANLDEYDNQGNRVTKEVPEKIKKPKAKKIHTISEAASSIAA